MRRWTLEARLLMAGEPRNWFSVSDAPFKWFLTLGMSAMQRQLEYRGINAELRVVRRQL